MDIKKVIFLLLLSLPVITCRKSNLLTCEQNNRTHINTNCFFTISPDIDSFPVNQPLEIKISLPKKFIEETYGRPVEFHKNEVFSAMNIIVLDSVASGAVNYFNLNAFQGRIYRDSISFDTEYVRNRNLAATAISTGGDTLLKGHYAIIPKQRGNYMFAFSAFGTKDTDCSLFRYFVKPQVSSQHLHLLAAANHGYVGDYERTFAYCFKVY